MKKKTITVLIVFVAVILILTGSICINDCQNHWEMFRFYKSVDFDKNVMGRELKKAIFLTINIFIDYLSALIIIFICFMFNKTELKAMTCSVKEYREKKQTEKQQKQEAKKQRKIEALEKELENLKDK